VGELRAEEETARPKGLKLGVERPTAEWGFTEEQPVLSRLSTSCTFW